MTHAPRQRAGPLGTGRTQAYTPPAVTVHPGAGRTAGTGAPEEWGRSIICRLEGAPASVGRMAGRCAGLRAGARSAKAGRSAAPSLRIAAVTPVRALESYWKLAGFQVSW